VKTLDPGTYSLCEAVADLSANFAVAAIVPADSRHAVHLCIEWAVEFEALYKGVEWGLRWGGEYIDAIDEFFETKYREWLAEPCEERRENK